MVETPKIPEFTPEIENQLREFLRPGIDQQCVKILFNYLMAEQFGVWEMFRTDVRGFSEDNVTMDMAEHIGGHAWAEARAGYGLPKMDLGISFWFGKLDRVEAALLAGCEKFAPVSHREAASLKRMKEMLLRYCREVLGSMDRKADVNALIKQGYERDLRFGEFVDHAKAGNNYSFFVFLLPFYRDEDGRSLLLAYRRRVKFLDFFEKNFRPEKKREDAKENEGDKQNAVAKVTTDTVINAGVILGLSTGDEVVNAMYGKTNVIDDFSADQILDLIAKITDVDAGYKIGQGDTKQNFILEKLIYVLMRKIDNNREGADRVLALLGEKAPIAREMFPSIIAARKSLLALFSEK